MDAGGIGNDDVQVLDAAFHQRVDPGGEGVEPFQAAGLPAEGLGLLAGPAPGEEHLRISAAGEQLFLVFKVVYMIRMPAHLLQMARPDLQGHFFAVGVHNDDVHSASLLSPVLCRGVRPPT